MAMIKDEMDDIEMSSADYTDDNKDDYDLIQSDTKTPGEILDEFCMKLQDVNATIPDPIILHYMKKAGFIVNDPKLVKIVSLASQKFISDIINDCMQYNKLKTNTKSNQQTGATASATSTVNQAQTASANAQQKSSNAVLTLEDLTTVLQDYGINVKKPQYFM